MKWIYKVIRTVLVCLVALLLGLPAVIYVMLSLPVFQSAVARQAEDQLSDLLGVNVAIGRVDIAPFNRVTLTDIVISDSTALTHGPIAVIDRLGGGVNIFVSLREQSLVINYVELMGLRAHIWRADKESPLNIEPVIRALKPKDKERKPSTFTLAVNSIIIRKAAVAYDVLSEPNAPDGVFDPAHIAVSDFSADVRIPRIAADDYSVDIRRLRAVERSGLQLTFKGLAEADNSRIALSGASVTLNDSRVDLDRTILKVDSLKYIGRDLPHLPLSTAIMPGSRLRVADLSPFVPALAVTDLVVDIEAGVSGEADDLRLSDVRLSWQGQRGYIHADAHVSGLMSGRDKLVADLPKLNVVADGRYVESQIIAAGRRIPSKAVVSALERAGEIRLEASGRYAATSGATLKAALNSAICDLTVDAEARGQIAGGRCSVDADIDIARCDLSDISPKARLGELSAKAGLSATVSGGRCLSAGARVDIGHLDWNSHRWDDLSAVADYDGHTLTADIDSSDPDALLSIRGQASVGPRFATPSDIRISADVDHLSLDMLPVGSRWGAYDVSFDAQADIDDIRVESMEAVASVSGIRFVDSGGENIDLGDIHAEVHNSRTPMWARLESEFVDVALNGVYDFRSLPYDVRGVVAGLFPSLVTPSKAPRKGGDNDFKIDISLNDSRRLEQLVKLPVSVIHPVEINGSINSIDGSMALSVDAPYLLNKNKVIENTSVHVGLDGYNGRSAIYLTTVMPTKNGPMALTLDGAGSIDALDAQLLWDVESERAFHGVLDLSVALQREGDGPLHTDIDIRRSEMVVNNAPWTINPAHISIAGKRIEVDRWLIGNGDQYLTIGGVASADPDDVAQVELHNIDLDYIFDTLSIPNVDFGGVATGTVTLRDAFSGDPKALTDDLLVNDMTYNDCLFGDAKIVSTWDNTRQAVTIDADITRRDGGGSSVNGAIWPVKDGGRLDLSFGADRTAIGFLQPFMAAFCSAITGEVSGHARLFGTFSDLDLEGDAFVRDMKMTIPFTNTTYMASDSVHFRPGNIQIENLTLTDGYGGTARFSGWLRHRYFHDPVFDFSLYDARDFLCYSVAENDEQPWYGRIFANGGASITGRPGVVDINVNVSTAPQSTFGFILSDTQSAGEYTFITFRDRDAMSGAVVDDRVALVPEAVRKVKDKIRQESESSTVFNMSLAVEANPNVAVTLVMDPVAGDRIKAWGNGNLRMTYSSRSDDMQIFGTYELERGAYNFTLQDIIVKDFMIDPGSSIAFHGNPYAAQLDMTAAYQTTANLTDLDESFKDDKDLNRTSVPVRALLKIRGDMRQPDLSFDLDFPTLTSDIDRKVRSLVNTEEMLNRQVIYLLALNRFYTPEYNSGSTRNNEFASLATNTLSSRISSLLGTISDNWTIAPSVRSDQGDFSDMEVDLALSSHLLNNRLLINGNLGYRDKSLNTTSFIGDFDIEYLLNRSGSIRLKAYNRFNDQTFYVKSALTTQGVGVVFKRDFDNFDSWLKPFRRKKPVAAPPAPAAPSASDSIVTDSVK